jgi:tripartite-type tricarboxylate transporter receptor subunit TctC
MNRNRFVSRPWRPGLLGLTVLAVAGAAAFAAGPTQADAAEFYKGKRVALYVGNHPGGGYDAYTRLLARSFGRHVPGNPGTIVRNMPGAAGIRLANYLYNSAEKDGTQMGVFASSVAFAPLFGETKAQFKTEKFTWIGNIDQTTGTCTAWHTAGIKTFDDLLKQPMIFGATGPNGVNSEHPRGFNALIGTRIQVIHGYPGSTGVLLAMKRGEVQGGCGFALSSLKARRREEWKSGKLVIVVQTGFKKHPDLAGVPHIYDYVKTDDDKKVLDLIYGRHILGRPLAAPPDLPADRAKALRAAFMATMKDPEFVKGANTQHLPIEPWDGEEVTKIVNQFLGYPPAVIKRARAAMEIGKVVKVKLKKTDGRITKVSKKKIQVTDGSGKKFTFKISGRQSKVTIGGKKAKTKALEAGLDCTFRHFGNGDLAKAIACK